jgi:hypothetical protein
LGAQQAQAGIRSLGNTASQVTQQVNTLSARREFMAGQRLQSTITSSLGINNGLTQAIDGFERLNYMAQASNMSLGQFFKTVGPGALATAGAVGGITMAWSAWNSEISKSNQRLTEMGYKAQTAWEFTKQLLGFGEGIQSTSGMTARLMKEVDEPTVASELEKFRAANPRADISVLRTERDRLIAEENLAKESYARDVKEYEEAEKSRTAIVKWGIAHREHERKAAEDKRKAEGDDLLSEARRLKGLAAERDAQEGANRLSALQPWMAEMQNPKGFAATTLSNSIEGVRAVNLAATMGERTDATQRALAEQVRLLEDIRTNTGNQTQTTTVGAL